MLQTEALAIALMLNYHLSVAFRAVRNRDVLRPHKTGRHMSTMRYCTAMCRAAMAVTESSLVCFGDGLLFSCCCQLSASCLLPCHDGTGRRQGVAVIFPSSLQPCVEVSAGVCVGGGAAAHAAGDAAGDGAEHGAADALSRAVSRADGAAAAVAASGAADWAAVSALLPSCYEPPGAVPLAALGLLRAARHWERTRQ